MNDELKKVEELKKILSNDGTDIYTVYNKIVDTVDRVSRVWVRSHCEGFSSLSVKTEKNGSFGTNPRKGAVTTGTSETSPN